MDDINFNDVYYVFETFEEAMDIHKKLFEIMKENGVLTYADFISSILKTNAVYEPDCYIFGWKNLFYVKVEPYEDRWILRMPELIKIK